MNFLAIVFALAAERMFPHGTALGESRVLSALLRSVRKLGAVADNPALPWLLTIAAVAVTLVLDQILSGAVAQVVFGGLLLFFCLGPRDLSDDVQRLIAARSRGDTAETERLSRNLQQSPSSGPAPDESHRSLIGALFIQSHERLFGVLLWFMALGPAAAIGYRIASRLPQLLDQHGFGNNTRQAADQLHGLLAWLPTRIAAGLFALAGSMDDALDAWRKIGELHYAEAWRSHSWAVLAEVSASALSMQEEDGRSAAVPSLDSALREVLRMQTRALLLLLGGFAVFTSGTLL